MTDDTSGEAVNDVPPPVENTEPEAEAARLTIKFGDTNNNEVTFKMKSTTPFKKAMDAYAQRVERERHTLRFIYDGDRINDNHTPADFGMEDEDRVDVHAEQIGGGGEGEGHNQK